MTKDRRVIRARFADWKPLQGYKVLRLYVEVPIEDTHKVLTLLGTPTGTENPIWVAVARLVEPKTDNGGRAPVAPDEHSASEAARGSADGGSLPTEMNPSRSDAPAKRRWHEMSRAQRAGMLCEDEAYQRWHADMLGPGVWDQILNLSTKDRARWAATMTRLECEVTSRADFDEFPAPAARWDALEARFLQATGRMAVDR